MATIIKKGSSPGKIREQLAKLQKKEKKEGFKELCGSIKLSEDPVKLQRQWRDEWK